MEEGNKDNTSFTASNVVLQQFVTNIKHVGSPKRVVLISPICDLIIRPSGTM